MVSMLLTGSPYIDAERAFDRAARRRSVANVVRRLRGRPTSRLAVHDPGRVRALPASGIREIPLDAISGTLEPSRAEQFDADFRPARVARERWKRVWLAEQRGAALPPISVVPIGDEFALRDGHHRVSVAKARGARTIDARLDDTLVI
jgi:hypothetical protein